MSEGFKKAQRLAYDAALEVADGLRPGVTEKQAAARLAQAIFARGCDQYFHRPFAWFGDRTKFAGFRGKPFAFFPTDRRLEHGMVGILDVAPIVDGYTADIGYTFRCGGPDQAFERAMATLREIRDLIPQQVARGETMRNLYVRVERLLGERGYDNRHARYPFGVLGHRVEQVKPRPRERTLGGFGLSSAARLLGSQLLARLPTQAARSPLWTREDARPLEPGLWAIEPHLGADGFGAKFEELLVVEPGAARWLDDALPHVTSTRNPAATAA